MPDSFTLPLPERRSGLAAGPDRPLTFIERDALRELRRRFQNAESTIALCLEPGTTLDAALQALGKVEHDTGGLVLAVASKLGGDR
jgi:hypothetical protein